MSLRVRRIVRPVAQILALFALASHGDAAESAWFERPWLSDEGLPNNTVNAIAQTPDGYLWIATANGLSRFDGVEFQQFSSTNFISLPDRGILAMSVTRAGGLWLATDRSAIVLLNNGTNLVVSNAQELPNFSVNALMTDSEGALWIMYRGGSVCRLKDGHARRFTGQEGLPEGVTICSMASDKAGRTWFVKGGQLGIFREEKFQALIQLDSLPARLTAARNGGVWVCCGTHLFKCDENGKLEDHGSFNPRRATEPSSMLESRDGAVWIGTTFNGLFRHAQAAFESIPTTHQEILGLAEDAKENIWVGTGGGGLNQVRPRAMQLQTTASGLPFETVLSLTQDSDGTIWAITADGSWSRLAGERWSAVAMGTNWNGDARCIAADPTGGLWVGTRYHGLLRWRENHFVNWGNPGQIKSQTIHTLVVSRNGDVWIGGDNPASVMRLRNGQIQNYKLPPDIRVIRASAEDAAGNIWYGTSKGILLRVEGDRVVEETARTTGEPQPIRCIYALPDGGLWFGYAGAGVGVLKNGKFAIINAQQGLYDDFVSQIVADDKGWLWFGANRGVFKVRQQELEAVAAGREQRVRSIHYGQGDGLPGLQANFGISPMSLRSQDGRLWLAMRTALVTIDPGKLRENMMAPPVLLTRARVNDRTVAEYGGLIHAARENGVEVLDLAKNQGGLRVPPDNHIVEFNFTALNFVAPENVSLRYRLVGFDDDWLEAGAPRKAIYPHLPAGDYRFEASACNSEGIWSATPATLGFVVTPFFWQTWWFRTSAVLMFTGVVIAIVRYVSFRRLHGQLRLLEEQAALHKERARIARDIHDDLGASLTQISLVGELARQDRHAPEKVDGHIEKLGNAARMAVKSLDEIVWAVNPRNDTLAHFIDYTGQFALDYLRLAGIRCRLDLPDQTPHRELSTDIRHNLFLVVKEAINNTVKYAHASEVRLHITADDGKLVIVIEDNGRGFDQPSEDADADGLRNMCQRAGEIGGRCWIQGRPGAGAKISVELPLNKTGQ